MTRGSLGSGVHLAFFKVMRKRLRPPWFWERSSLCRTPAGLLNLHAPATKGSCTYSCVWVLSQFDTEVDLTFITLYYWHLAFGIWYSPKYQYQYNEILRSQPPI